MPIANDLAALFNRDLTRLVQQLGAFPADDQLWQRRGSTNTAGNLVLHLEGNLREFIGRQLGRLDYTRDRPREFGAAGIPITELIQRIEEVRALVSSTLTKLDPQDYDKPYPENVLGVPLTTGAFLIHLYGHLNYHLGQIDYLRRMLTEGEAIQYAGL